MLFDYIKNSFVDIEPRSFAGLMELYEDNYMKLRRLIPDLDSIGVGAISRVIGEVPLILEVIERQRYTSTILLTHRFINDGLKNDDPCLTVRLCHDARTAEAMIDENSRRFGYIISCKQRSDFSLESRWELNYFLNKWLKYCISQGHSFNLGEKINKVSA